MVYDFVPNFLIAAGHIQFTSKYRNVKYPTHLNDKHLMHIIMWSQKLCIRHQLIWVNQTSRNNLNLLILNCI